jgi:hypothetical protein
MSQGVVCVTIGPAEFVQVTANTTYSAATGFGFVPIAGAAGLPLPIGSVDSVLPDQLHRSLLWGSERTTFRLDIPAARLDSSGGDLLVTLISGVTDFAIEPMEFL